jgi:uncharacterized protein (TIGR00645 family)
MISSRCRTHRWVVSRVEDVILYSRYLLVPLSIALLYQILLIGVDFYRVQFGQILEESLTEHTVIVLQLVDIMMIANFVWLIAVGSYYVFVDTGASKKKRPRCLTHISSGILKEKMAGSLIGVASVHLIQVFLHLDKSDAALNWSHLAAQLIIYLTFIFGLLAFCKTNAAIHHQHDSSDQEATHETH